MWLHRRVVQASLVLALITFAVMLYGDGAGKTTDDEGLVSPEDRADAIARAQIWRRPSTPIAQADLSPKTVADVDCRFTITDLSGTTPKFHCKPADGREMRAKYGSGAEIPAEVATTRLLSALGFGADSVTLVERIHCYGCPRAPFLTMKVVEAARAKRLFEKVVNEDQYQEFEWVALEDKFEAPSIESHDAKGWAFYELDLVNAARGGAPRAHVDALRLLAVFLAHWDNKADNQRLVCLSQEWAKGNPCPEPFLLLQDVGATFGPRKVDLDAWESTAMWDDRARCSLAMRDLPYGGGTFSPVRITESGRQFLAGLLGELSEVQLTDLFSGARFDQLRGPSSQSTPVSEWVRVFRKRVDAITDGPPCPGA
jgi:hypothetical protein